MPETDTPFIRRLQEIKEAAPGEGLFLAMKPRWFKQVLNLHNHQITDCAGCGQQRLRLEQVFRCFYCGLFFCATCCETHFGMTRAEYFTTSKTG